MNKAKGSVLFLMCYVIILSFSTGIIETSNVFGQQADPKAFKTLKEQSIDPKSGLPRTLDPNSFTGNAKAAYMVAKEIPQVLVEIPCYCGCDAYGHENLLDCFVDKHGAG
jgi:hypothetical protein